MAVKITKRGIAGKDLNTAWTNTGSTLGITKNIFRWGAGNVDEGNDEVGLVPFAYVHWGNGSAGNSTINRRWNVSSISQQSTGRWWINFDTDWNLSEPEYDKVVPYVNGQRYHATSDTQISNHYVPDSTGMGYASFQVTMRSVGTSAGYTDTAYSWAVVLGPGRFENVASSGNTIIDTRGITKSYTPSGHNRMQPCGLARFDTTLIGNGQSFSQTSTFGTTSFTKLGTGRFTWNYNFNGLLDGTPFPMILSLGHRPGTTTQVKVSIPSNTTYSATTTTFRNHNVPTTNNPNGTVLDFVSHLVAY